MPLPKEIETLDDARAVIDALQWFVQAERNTPGMDAFVHETCLTLLDRAGFDGGRYADGTCAVCKKDDV